MLDTYEKFQLVDEDKKNNFFIEVNFKLDDELTNGCKILRVTFPNGDVSYLKREYLNELLFAIGKPEDQQKMIPQTLETVHHYKTVLGLKATKDISKNEMINFPINLSIACSSLRQDVIGSLPKEYQGALLNKPPTGLKSKL